MPPAPEKHNLRLPEGFVLMERKKVQRSLPDPTYRLVIAKQGSFWAEGKDFQRTSAKSVKENWHDWWEEVRQTGFCPPKWLPRLVSDIEMDLVLRDQENFVSVKTHQRTSWGTWGKRLKGNQIGPILRDLQLNKGEGANQDLILIQSSLLRKNRFIPFFKRETISL